MISLIASVGKNLEIGKAGDLAFEGRGELGYFKDTTMGRKILMGSRTYESLPRRLEGREYFVVATNDDFPDWVNVVNDPETFLKKWQQNQEEIFVIGGGMIYALALPYASKLYLTEIDGTCDGADTFFPKFNHSEFRQEFIENGTYDSGTKFQRFIYARK